MTVELGNWYRDTLGVVGVATARIEHLGGSPEVKLEWLGADDERKETWVQEDRLTEVRDERAVGFRNGGPR